MSAATCHHESFLAQRRAGRAGARSNLGLALSGNPERVQPRGLSATQRPFLELRATPPEVPQLVRARVPRPSPVSKLRSGARGAPTSLQCPEGRGAAAALGCDPGGFTSGSRFAGAGRGGLGVGRARAVPAGRRGLALGTPGVSRDPRLPALTFRPKAPLRCSQICCVSAAATAPSRLQTPERRWAAWAAGGESCEAAGSGLICWLLGRLAVSQKCSCPFPHPLGSHLAPHPFTSPELLLRYLI